MGARDLGDDRVVVQQEKTVRRTIPNDSVEAKQLTEGVRQSLLPPGAILDFAGDTPPLGFLLCDGSAIDRNIFGDLFAAIGTSW